MKTLRLALFALILFLSVSPVRAHNWLYTEVRLYFVSETQLIADFYYDLDAWMMGVRPGHMAPEIYEYIYENTTEAERTEQLDEMLGIMKRHVKFFVDNEPLEVEAEFPDLGKEHPYWELPPGPWPGIRTRFHVTLPDEGNVQFSASRMYGPITYLVAELGATPPDDAAESEPFIYKTMLGPGSKGPEMVPETGQPVEGYVPEFEVPEDSIEPGSIRAGMGPVEMRPVDEDEGTTPAEAASTPVPSPEPEKTGAEPLTDEEEADSAVIVIREKGSDPPLPGSSSGSSLAQSRQIAWTIIALCFFAGGLSLKFERTRVWFILAAFILAVFGCMWVWRPVGYHRLFGDDPWIEKEAWLAFATALHFFPAFARASNAKRRVRIAIMAGALFVLAVMQWYGTG